MKKPGFLIVLILFISLTNVHSQETSAVDTGTIENLVVLAKVWGFLKYHHPRITTGDLDWDNELINILPSVLAVMGPSNRNTVLLNWVEKIGLPPACSPCAGLPANPPNAARSRLLPANWPVWQCRGRIRWDRETVR